MLESSLTSILISVFQSLFTMVPIAKASVFNTALPSANADILGAAISPTNSPSFLRIYISVAVAGQLYITRTVSSVTVSEYLNSGANLAVNAAYMFDIPWATGDTVNIRYSATGGNILCLRALEIGAAA